MIQDQLVDYINTQLRIGVSREAVKSTLVSAGWQAADVEDTLKKVESTAVAQPVAAAVSSTTTIKPEPQTIKVSDLVSVSDPALAVKPAAAATTVTTTTTISAKDAAAKSPLTGPTAKPVLPAVNASKSQNTFIAPGYAEKPHGGRGTLITEIALGAVILVVAGFAGFLYFQNSSLSSKLAALSGQSSGVTSQLSMLQQQYVASTTALTAQATTLGQQSQELQMELSFYAAPTSTTAGATSTASFSGTVSGGGKFPYVLAAMHGAKIYVANSKSASVITALTPLVASGTAQFSGTYVPGSDNMTLTSVNGAAVQ